MIVGKWQIGLHIQSDSIVAVALVRKRGGWRQQRWWRFPLAPHHDGEPRRQALIEALTPWRAQLPRYSSIRLGFPAQRTLQRELPRPATTLCEPECEVWLGAVAARQLSLPPDALAFDYTERQDGYAVTAARAAEVAELMACARALRFTPAALTPDASALACLLPYTADACQVIVAQTGTQWLWAMRDRWGVCATPGVEGLRSLGAQLGIQAQEIALRGASWQEGDWQAFDPWQVITWPCLPKPEDTGCFAVALGLALGAA
ncbi:pilus assembly protein [Cronobacter sakazakii]|uniref:pilus assembly protein n=1 Tax=Cronobacter sakazakii TaxID=28141 RepID=UPI000BE878FB|nr:pilus assembly protein [Cronobacter sakazakii]PQV84904.1 pilus assembly protein [Cronobacter sakazakii]PQV91690.1 pilus assembly protein [Cronobacter sakazakii]PQX93995.1 pilus assembly protein [Cronobacter sakazakii]PUV62245.1 pilus assembly protein [Cronobacter sakazakii]